MGCSLQEHAPFPRPSNLEPVSFIGAALFGAWAREPECLALSPNRRVVVGEDGGGLVDGRGPSAFASAGIDGLVADDRRMLW